MQINREMLQQFRVDFKEAVKDLEKKYGLVLELGRISFGNDNFSGKLEARAGTDIIDANATEFNRYCSWYNLKPKDFMSTVRGGDGRMYQITGLARNSRKYPIRVKDVITGKTYKAAREWLKVED